MKKKRFLISIFAIIALIFLSIGGKMYMTEKKINKNMLDIVKSDDVKKIFEDGLKNLEPTALTSDGIIQSYEIDYDSMKQSIHSKLVELKRSYQTAIESTHILWSKAQSDAALHGTNLSSLEQLSALAAGNVTESSIIGEPVRKYEEDIAKISAQEIKYDQLLKQSKISKRQRSYLMLVTL